MPRGRDVTCLGADSVSVQSVTAGGGGQGDLRANIPVAGWEDVERPQMRKEEWVEGGG